MPEIKSISVDKLNNGWVVWLIDQNKEFDNPNLCYYAAELFSCIKEFFGVSELFHVNENVSQIVQYEKGFIVHDGTKEKPSMFVTL